MPQQIDTSTLTIGAKGGLCYRTACRLPGATWYNSSTRAYYCADCARQINEFSERVDGYALCAIGDRSKMTTSPPPPTTTDAGIGWISVKDRLPECDLTVLTWVNGFHWLAYRDGTYGGYWHGMWETEEWEDPTHWMPLPNGPNGERSHAPDYVREEKQDDED
jgi:hypothetical protein